MKAFYCREKYEIDGAIQFVKRQSPSESSGETKISTQYASLKGEERGGNDSIKVT